MICHFPLEWDKTTVDNRFQWLAKENDVLPEPMELCDLGPLTDHAKALCLAENPLPSGRVWHFEPTRFIEHFRKCGWLSNKEMKQLIPTKALSNGQWQTIFTIEALHFGKPVQLLIYREQGSELIIQG